MPRRNGPVIVVDDSARTGFPGSPWAEEFDICETSATALMTPNAELSDYGTYDVLLPDSDFNTTTYSVELESHRWLAKKFTYCVR